mmetsp:Transcript_8739/g.25942  ORF Transcript_8739/g.25942 Transcript_8739/m.25942 type:complete len:112 (-) Transcript_8739:9-344(-)
MWARSKARPPLGGTSAASGSDPATPRPQAVLDTLGWRWGPAHIEVKQTSRGPVLVEVNAGRFNGVDFGLLADVCVGHNAYDVTLDAYFDQAAWAALPALPPRALRGAGRGW